MSRVPAGSTAEASIEASTLGSLPPDRPGGPSGSELVPGGTTPVPNVLLDAVMPRLRDTELRVLLVVVRQTLGWQAGPDPARRKERDWLTQSQLMRRTGRASGAVAGAVDALVRSGLVEVTDRAGAPLRTPAERRRHLGRLYYRLALPPCGVQSAKGPKAAVSKAMVSKSEHAKSNTTKESRYKTIGRTVKIVDKPVENPIVIRGRGWLKAGTCHVFGGGIGQGPENLANGSLITQNFD